jgi:small subunit ribosomal protein S3
MGQKVNPNGFRLQIRKDWSSVWCSNDTLYSKFIEHDFLTRKIINEHYKNGTLSKIIIERSDCVNQDEASRQNVQIFIHSSNTGYIVGKSGKELDTLKNKLCKRFLNTQFKIAVIDIKRPDVDANLVAQNIAIQLKRRASYKRVVKKALESAMRFDDCLGIKITCSGRLAGAEIAKSEIFKSGSIPLHKLTANIYYGFAEANTTYGIIGIKVWIYFSN